MAHAVTRGAQQLDFPSRARKPRDQTRGLHLGGATGLPSRPHDGTTGSVPDRATHACSLLARSSARRQDGGDCTAPARKAFLCLFCGRAETMRCKRHARADHTNLAPTLRPLRQADVSSLSTHQAIPITLACCGHHTAGRSSRAHCLVLHSAQSLNGCEGPRSPFKLRCRGIRQGPASQRTLNTRSRRVIRMRRTLLCWAGGRRGGVSPE